MQRCKTTDVGECPTCGGSLCILRAKSGGRYVKCDNPQCTGGVGQAQTPDGRKVAASFSYPLPRAGKISGTGETCPERDLPVLLVEKQRPSNTRYFWVEGPCFGCPRNASCAVVRELTEEYLD
jgi:ssDNA-binding Zn-finger/Zn-ribbon topoisomerase 1